MAKIYRTKTKDGKHTTYSIRVQIDGRRHLHNLGTDIGLADARVRARKKGRTEG